MDGEVVDMSSIKSFSETKDDDMQWKINDTDPVKREFGGQYRSVEEDKK